MTDLKHMFFPPQGCTMFTWNTLKDWNPTNTIAIEDLMKNAQTGDIILFDNEAVVGTCLIKCFTRSDFDHVAVVIRYPEPLGVRMLEVCSFYTPPVLHSSSFTLP